MCPQIFLATGISQEMSINAARICLPSQYSYVRFRVIPPQSDPNSSTIGTKQCLILCNLTLFNPDKMLIISKFSHLNQISLGRLQIAIYNTPILQPVLSNGWNQSKFNIRLKCESTTSGLKKFSDVLSLVPLNVFQTRPSYISVNMSSKPDRLANVLKNFRNLPYKTQ